MLLSEPVLPPERTRTICVLGATAFGQPIRQAAHRPAIYARLAGAPWSAVITPEMAKKHPYRNIITRAVGIDPVVEVDVLSEDKQLDDLWLVCSDGLYNMVDDKDIEEILNTLHEEKAADRLLELALENGGTDNVSFVLGRVMEVQGE